MSDNLGTLHRHLFAELSRLGEIDAKDTDAMTAEVERARAVCQVGSVIVENAKLALEVHEACAVSRQAPPKMLGVGQE